MTVQATRLVSNEGVREKDTTCKVLRGSRRVRSGIAFSQYFLVIAPHCWRGSQQIPRVERQVLAAGSVQEMGLPRLTGS